MAGRERLCPLSFRTLSIWLGIPVLARGAVGP